MKPIVVKNHTKYSLEFIFNEADKMSTEILKSISENINKSFLLIAIYFSILSFSFIKLVENYNFLYLILVAGTIISSLILRHNIFPNIVVFKGSLPEKMINSYFDDFSNEELDKEYLATQIETYNSAIVSNIITIKRMVNRFRYSIFCMLIFLGFFGIIYFFLLFTECS